MVPLACPTPAFGESGWTVRATAGTRERGVEVTDLDRRRSCAPAPVVPPRSSTLCPSHAQCDAAGGLLVSRKLEGSAFESFFRAINREMCVEAVRTLRMDAEADAEARAEEAWARRAIAQHREATVDERISMGEATCSMAAFWAHEGFIDAFDDGAEGGGGDGGIPTNDLQRWLDDPGYDPRAALYDGLPTEAADEAATLRPSPHHPATNAGTLAAGSAAAEAEPPPVDFAGLHKHTLSEPPALGLPRQSTGECAVLQRQPRPPEGASQPSASPSSKCPSDEFGRANA